ncbi:MAG: ABC transporter permease [Candidatus Saccharibacteria bacterium]
MKYFDIVRTANSNLRKSKVRTFLTVTAVVIGAFTLTMTNGLGDGIKSYVNTQLGNVGAKDSLFVTARSQDKATKEANNGLTEYNPERKKVTVQVNGPPGSLYMTNKDVVKIAAIPGVKEVIKTYTILPDYMTTGYKKFQTTVSQYTDGFNIDLEAGRLVNNNSAEEITLPQTYLKPLGLGENAQAVLGKTITFAFTNATGQQFTKTATIVGVQRSTLVGSAGINASSTWVKEVYDLQTGILTANDPQYVYLIARFDINSTKAQQDALKKNFNNAGYEALTIQDQIGVVNKILNAVTVALNIFGGIALLAASFGIINTLFMSVQERTREIGLMKALGMGRGKIFLLFSLEAIFIGFWGSLLGIGFANIAGRVLNKIAANTFLKGFEGFKLVAFPWQSMLLVIGIIVVISFLAGSLPARRASRKDPIEALRYE